MSLIARLGHPVLESLGFDSDYLRQPIENDIDEQISDTSSIFPDTGISGQKIDSLEVSKLTAGTLSIGSYIQSGQTAFNTGIGFWLGNIAGTPKFSIGNSGGNRLTWDGTSLEVVGDLISNFGDGSDGAINITSGITTINTASKYVYQYTDFSVTGTAQFACGSNLFEHPIYILVQGDLTITSSATPAINWDYAGGAGGVRSGRQGTGNLYGSAGGYWDGAIEWNNNDDQRGHKSDYGSESTGAGSEGGGGGGGGGWGTAGSAGTPGDGTLQNPSGGAGGDTTEYGTNTQPMRHILAPFIGGGGGSGSSGTGTYPSPYTYGGAGGAGGGAVIFIVRGNVNISGKLYARGAAGEAGESSLYAGYTTHGGGGGGGGGGFIGIYYKGTLTNTATFAVTGGAAGASGGGTAGAGGAGGNGRYEVKQIKTATFAI